MNKGQVDYAVRQAHNLFDTWNDVAGVFEIGTGSYAEILSVITDSVHCGIQMATQGRIDIVGNEIVIKNIELQNVLDQTLETLFARRKTNTVKTKASGAKKKKAKTEFTQYHKNIATVVAARGGAAMNIEDFLNLDSMVCYILGDFPPFLKMDNGTVAALDVDRVFDVGIIDLDRNLRYYKVWNGNYSVVAWSVNNTVAYRIEGQQDTDTISVSAGTPATFQEFLNSAYGDLDHASFEVLSRLDQRPTWDTVLAMRKNSARTKLNGGGFGDVQKR